MHVFRITGLLALLAIISCKSNETGNAADVNQDQVYQEYFVEVDENKGNCFVSACFRFAGPNGTTLVVDSTGTISFDQAKLNRSHYLTGGTFYRNTLPFTGDMLHRFTWVNHKQEKVINEVRTEGVELPGFESTWSLFIDTMLAINVPHMHDSEQVIVEIADTSTNVRFEYNAQALKHEKVILSGQLLQSLKPGKATLSITRELKIQPAERTKAGGMIHTRYIERRRNLELKP